MGAFSSLSTPPPQRKKTLSVAEVSMLGQTHKQSSCCSILLLQVELVFYLRMVGGATKLPRSGIVNAQFCHIQTLKTEEEPDHVVQLINTYCIDVESILSELGSFIDLPDVDFSKLVALAQQVEESSSLMGAEHMRLACAGLIQACRQMDKRNLSLSLNWIKNEFAHIRTKLEVVVQMERKIMRLESKHKK